MNNLRRDTAYIATMILWFGIIVLLFKIAYMQDTIDILRLDNAIYQFDNTVHHMNLDCVDGMTWVYVHAIDTGRAIETEKPIQCNISFTK